MKLISCIFISLLSFNSFSKEICSNYENKIEADHQWNESDFTKENAENALKIMNQAVQSEVSLDWYEYPNLSTLVEGYILKSQFTINPSDRSRDRFCNFLIRTPIVD